MNYMRRSQKDESEANAARIDQYIRPPAAAVVHEVLVKLVGGSVGKAQNCRDPMPSPKHLIGRSDENV